MIRASARSIATAALVALCASLPAGCGARLPVSALSGRPDEVPVEQIAAELDAMSRGLTADYRETFDAILSDHLAKDAYRCTPSARTVLSEPASGMAARRIHGCMPHYGLYDGPMLYRVRAASAAPAGVAGEQVGQGSARWVVELNVAILAAEQPNETMELPDCELSPQLEGPVHCEGIAYPDAPGVDACPDVGRFEALATRHNLRALMRRWSTDVEQSYNRDAEAFALPVRYDFEFFLADDAGAARGPVDMRLPLTLSCARMPYFLALRTGWSVPVVAHEMAHFLGLLDEYETFSGIVSFYPKTPFEGAEQSRMGLSMKRHTRFLPLHHYLILRRYHCPEPSPRNPYEHLFKQ